MVVAKHEFAFKGNLYQKGDKVVVNENELKLLINDVTVIEESAEVVKVEQPKKAKK